MITLEIIKSKMKNYIINVQVDYLLINKTRNRYPIDSLTGNQLQISINLYKLIMNIGTIQSIYFKPTNRQRFIDKMYLAEKVHDDDRLLIKINEIRKQLGSEKLAKISEDFGIGLALSVADYLYRIDSSTVVPIKATNKRPDIRCFTMSNEELIIESKGYSNQRNLYNQKVTAVDQKNSRKADIKVVSLTLINEEDATSTHFVDPPSEPDADDIEKRKKMMRAEHYSSVFNFFGQKELSEYYLLMMKKIGNENDELVVNDKENIFNKIKDTYVTIGLNHRYYYGTVEKVGKNKYTFLGVEEILLYFRGFQNFEVSESDISVEEQGNLYFIQKDGVIIGSIKNIEPFINQIHTRGGEIKHFQEHTTLTDVDNMDVIHFEIFTKYLFEENNFEVVTQKENYKDKGYDYVVSRNGIEYCVHLKHFKNPKRSIRVDDLELINDKRKVVFITNANVSPTFTSNLMTIDRNLLKRAIQKPDRLTDWLEN
ncbi:restriction endonuclease [Paenibacillus polysaccharolyticus]|uniref:restriction endonuclease n=1 Tax=Paenibacillus polysaccharolyticus TaxID=582692 RepID=UPI00209EFD3A|nr:restriction endonuclease [Paenibacillus polysaccharolyticus]MCP1132912.1 restriction endonuclease [Paenibacillus polysaccharolyticus]